jgi:hypothetical protein
MPTRRRRRPRHDSAESTGAFSHLSATTPSRREADPGSTARQEGHAGNCQGMRRWQRGRAQSLSARRRRPLRSFSALLPRFALHCWRVLFWSLQQHPQALNTVLDPKRATPVQRRLGFLLDTQCEACALRPVGRCGAPVKSRRPSSCRRNRSSISV